MIMMNVMNNELYNAIRIGIITGAGDYKVICYLESWAIYRPEPATSSPSDVDPQGCTHVIYSFLGLDKTLLTVSVLDHDYDVIRGIFFLSLFLIMNLLQVFQDCNF